MLVRNVLSTEHCGEKRCRNSPCRRTGITHTNCSHPGHRAIVGVFELPEFDKGLMISKRVMITFYHGLNERKTNLKYSLFQTITPFFCKIAEKCEFQKSRIKYPVDETP